MLVLLKDLLINSMIIATLCEIRSLDSSVLMQCLQITIIIIKSTHYFHCLTGIWCSVSHFFLYFK